MRWVDVPYNIDGDKMFTQRTTWPSRCACCGEVNAGGIYNLQAHLQTDYTNTGVHRSESGFRTAFPVPYCAFCEKHAGPVPHLRAYPWVGGFAIWVLVGWLLFINGLGENALGVTLFLVSAAVIGFGSYRVSQLLVDRLSGSRTKDTCSNNDYAVAISPAAGSWRLRFDSDDYANDFAWQNGLHLFAPEGEG